MNNHRKTTNRTKSNPTSLGISLNIQPSPRHNPISTCLTRTQPRLSRMQRAQQPISKNTASGVRVQPWKAFLKPVDDGTALVKSGADDMIINSRTGWRIMALPPNCSENSLSYEDFLGRLLTRSLSSVRGKADSCYGMLSADGLTKGVIENMHWGFLFVWS